MLLCNLRVLLIEKPRTFLGRSTLTQNYAVAFIIIRPLYVCVNHFQISMSARPALPEWWNEADEKKVENLMNDRVFFDEIRSFLIADETLSRMCLIYLLNRNKNLGVNGEV